MAWDDLNCLNYSNGFGVNPSVWTDSEAEFRMPSGERKGVVDERAEEVFGGIQA
jgi:hypothetical protein